MLGDSLHGHGQSLRASTPIARRRADDERTASPANEEQSASVVSSSGTGVASPDWHRIAGSSSLPHATTTSSPRAASSSSSSSLTPLIVRKSSAFLHPQRSSLTTVALIALGIFLITSGAALLTTLTSSYESGHVARAAEESAHATEAPRTHARTCLLPAACTNLPAACTDLPAACCLHGPAAACCLHGPACCQRCPFTYVPLGASHHLLLTPILPLPHRQEPLRPNSPTSRPPSPICEDTSTVALMIIATRAGAACEEEVKAR